jgi:hypothetical protein
MASLIPTTAPPSFRVTFTSADLDPSVATVTLFATADGVTRAVRTAINLGAAGGFTAFDAEPPTGIQVTYQALQFDIDGVQIGYTASISAIISAGPPSLAWLSDPLDETSAIQVVMTDTAGLSAARPIPGTIYTIGATAAVLSGVQGPVQGVDMSFYTQSAGDDELVRNLLKQSNGSVLLRTNPGFGVLIPRALYCFAGAAVPSYLDGTSSLWSNTVSELTPTTLPVLQSKTSWQDVIDGFASWTALESQFGSWIDVETSFD